MGTLGWRKEVDADLSRWRQDAQQRMEYLQVSSRTIARALGVAATTVTRALDGKTVPSAPLMLGVSAFLADAGETQTPREWLTDRLWDSGDRWDRAFTDEYVLTTVPRRTDLPFSQ